MKQYEKVFSTKGFPPLKGLQTGTPDREKKRDEQRKRLDSLFTKKQIQ